jgi:hypothetical protein
MTENLPPYLYHGTSTELLPAIQKEGIKPRKETKDATNWKHTIESNPDTVYLSDTYAPYFALAAVNTTGGKPVVLRIPTENLDEKFLVPDEDALEQGCRDIGPGPLQCPLNNMIERTHWYRKKVFMLTLQFPDLWLTSLRVLGTCGYRDTIPYTAVDDTYTFTNNNAVIIEWGDPMISILNYQIMGASYQEATAALFEGV